MVRTLLAAVFLAAPAAAQTTLLISNETGNSISTFNTATLAVGTYHTGIFNPDGLRFAPNGDLYATSFRDGTFNRVTGPNSFTTIATGFNGSAGFDRDAAGNHYVANFGAPSGFGSTISKVFPNGTVNHNFATGLSTPDDAKLDPSGTTLYVSEWLSNEISRVNLTTGAVSVFVPGTAGLDRPSAMQFDPAGNLYVTNWNTASVSRITPDGTVTHNFATGLPNSFGLLRDEAGGFFYATTWNQGNLVRFPLTGGPAQIVATGFTGPTFMAIQPVPEPASVGLFASAILGAVAAGRRRLRVAAALALSAAPAVAQPVVGFGAVGDSYAAEYQFATTRSTARSFSEQLATYRGVNFGEFRSTSQLSSGAPRDFGYQFNWAQGGSTTVTAMQGGQHTGLAAQVAAGQVNYAVIATGGNDFALPANYTPIYNGSLNGAALTTYINDVVGRVLTMHDTVKNAGAKTILVNIGDLSHVRAYQIAFPDPVGRQRVTDALAAANAQLKAAATTRSVPLIDVYGWSQTDAGNSATNSLKTVSGATFDRWNYQDNVSNPSQWYEDSAHAGSVYQGLYSNMIMRGANWYGAGLTPFTDQEIFANAGLTGFPAGPTYWDVTPFVVLPAPVPEPGMLLLLPPLLVMKRRAFGGSGTWGTTRVPL